jgi:hypothetical protein
MNLTIRTHSSTWKNARNRYVIGIGGVALAITVAIGGISALPDSGSRQASVTPVTRSQPSTLFQTSADAVFAVESGVEMAPRFGNAADAVEASVALVLAQQPSASAHEAYLGLGQPGERSATSAELENVAAGEAMAFGIFDSRSEQRNVESPQAHPLGDSVYSGMEVAEIPAPATTAPQFTSMADAVEALWYLEVQQVSVAPGLAQPVSPSTDSPDAYLGLGQPGERSAIPQLFSNYVDAWEASIRQ